LKPSEFWSLTWGEFNDLANVRLTYLDLEEEKKEIAKCQIMATIANTIPRQKGVEGYTYRYFMSEKYLSRHPKEEILPKSSPEILRDRIEKHNKNFPNDIINFDYDKFKN